MGFCRRCGDIVTGTRCKCGGTAVAPVLQWSSPKCHAVDKWSQTYIARDNSSTCSPVQIDGTCSTSQPSPALTGLRTEPVHCTPRCFRPSHVDSHIDSCTHPLSSSKRLSNTSERGSSSSPTTLAAEAGISPAPNVPELSKAYGSVLQPKEFLATYSCAICLTEFQPDATIFPDPFVPGLSDRFLCRPCFTINGGSKGDCPVCYRPVLILKSEGGFVETSGRVWHKRCFSCEGCHKNIGDTPMVDVLGQPSCADCFDSCLKRNSTLKEAHPTPSLEKANNRISVSLFKDSRSQGDSPTINGLEQKLGVVKSREGSPVLEELTQRLNAVLNRIPHDSSPSASFSASCSNRNSESTPLVPRTLERRMSATPTVPGQGIDPVDILADVDRFGKTRTSPCQTIRADSSDQGPVFLSTRPSLSAVEEMKSRFMNQVASPSVSLRDSISFPGSLLNSTNVNSPPPTPSRIPCMSRAGTSPGLRHTVSTSSLRSSRTSWTPSTPELIPDTLDTLTQSSGPSSPPPFSPQIHLCDNFVREHTPTRNVSPERHVPSILTGKPRDSLSKSSIPTATLSSGSLCAKCGGSLFATGGSGRFVSVPELSASGPPKTYHTECFRCVMCDGPFRETSSGRTIFVRREGGACHMECAPAEKTQAKPVVAQSPIQSGSPDSTLSPPPPLVPLTSAIQAVPKLHAGTNHTQPKGSVHHGNSLYSSSRYERPPPLTPALPSASSRFGSSVACPGCQKAVSPMEMGVVPGPQGSRWHATCLVCGGKRAGRGRPDKSQPGCGKRLDSAAKRDTQGGVWCRECLLLLPLHMRNAQVETSFKQQLRPSYTGRIAGGGPFITPQLTGTTTIARQFTGRGGGESGILRQLTGGGLSPTRQLAGSPTKQLGLATPRPRPKSVIGMRSSKSVDEGRGMYLVRQMTGGGDSSLV